MPSATSPPLRPRGVNRAPRHHKAAALLSVLCPCFFPPLSALSSPQLAGGWPLHRAGATEGELSEGSQGRLRAARCRVVPFPELDTAPSVVCVLFCYISARSPFCCHSGARLTRAESETVHSPAHRPSCQNSVAFRRMARSRKARPSMTNRRCCGCCCCWWWFCHLRRTKSSSDSPLTTCAAPSPATRVRGGS